jgi:hypothetical protein
MISDYGGIMSFFLFASLSNALGPFTFCIEFDEAEVLTHGTVKLYRHIKSYANQHLTLVDLVILSTRDSSLNSLDFLLIAFISAQNKKSRRFAHLNID